MIKRLSPAAYAHHPLQVYIERLLDLFHQALASSDPALFLYKNDARTPMFMAEALVRLLEAVSEDKKITKALKLFKKLEDMLGQINQYDELAAQFSKVRGIPQEQLDYFIKRGNKALDKLNKKLKEKDFYLQRFQEILLDLDMDFNNVHLIQALQEEMQLELKQCFDFYASFTGKPVSMEGQVHEIRRKLRWLCIYAQSLQGIVVLKPAAKRHAWEKAMITARELASPYLRVTVRKNLHKHIAFDQNAFYALGYMIEELGKIKDKGMSLEAFARMLEKTSDVKDPEAAAVKKLKLSYTVEGQLKKAGDLLDKFFNQYAIHEKLF